MRKNGRGTSSELNHRERVSLALSHRPTDRVPMDFGSTVVTGITLGAYFNLLDYLGLKRENPKMLSQAFQVVWPDEEIMEILDVDFQGVFYKAPRKSKAKIDSNGTFIDEWGILRKKPTNGHYYDIIKSPLSDASIDDLSNFEFPDPLDAGRFYGIKEEAQHLSRKTDYAIVGPGTDTNLFELAWFLRGFENLLMDLIVNAEFVHQLLQRLLEYRKAMIGQYLELVGEHLDVVYVGDDLATQTGPLMSLDTFHLLIKPYLADYYQFIKNRTKAKLLLHCCGSLLHLLDELIEIGVDIINPVQVSAKGMDTKLLKETYGKRLIFWGAIDTHSVLPNGSQDDVRDEVRKRITELGTSGGYVLAPVHNIQPDVPAANLWSMYDEARNFELSKD